MTLLPRSFYLENDVCAIARSLLGCVVRTEIDGLITTGLIVETEAYVGVSDRASHAWNGRRTARNEAMWMNGGIAYVYLCYGLHHMLNIVTNIEGVPHAVLIRATAPEEGLDVQMHRRKMQRLSPALSNGPGKCAQALGIDRRVNGMPLHSAEIQVYRKVDIEASLVIASPRVGVSYAGPDAALPYRFRISGHSFAGK